MSRRRRVGRKSWKAELQACLQADHSFTTHVHISTSESGSRGWSAGIDSLIGCSADSALPGFPRTGNLQMSENGSALITEFNTQPGNSGQPFFFLRANDFIKVEC